MRDLGRALNFLYPEEDPGTLCTAPLGGACRQTTPSRVAARVRGTHRQDTISELFQLVKVPVEDDRWVVFSDHLQQGVYFRRRVLDLHGPVGLRRYRHASGSQVVLQCALHNMLVYGARKRWTM